MFKTSTKNGILVLLHILHINLVTASVVISLVIIFFPFTFEIIIEMLLSD